MTALSFLVLAACGGQPDPKAAQAEQCMDRAHAAVPDLFDRMGQAFWDDRTIFIPVKKLNPILGTTTDGHIVCVFDSTNQIVETSWNGLTFSPGDHWSEVYKTWMNESGQPQRTASHLKPSSPETTQ